MVQVIKSAAAIAILPLFHQLKKYNLRSITTPDESGREGAAAAGKEKSEGEQKEGDGGPAADDGEAGGERDGAEQADT